MEAWHGANPPGSEDAAAAAAYVSSASAKLATLQNLLPGMVQMDWRSPAADGFSSLMESCVLSIGQTLGEFEAAKEALARYEAELGLLGQGDG